MAHDLPRALLSAALDAAGRGWAVFPLRPGNKRPALHSTARCPLTGPCATGHRTWEQRATVDTDRVTRCWQSAPYNIGIATGPARLVVVDLDTPKNAEDAPPAEWTGAADGMEVFAALCQRHGQPVPADTFTVRTGRGGLHLYFAAPEGKTLRSSGGSLGWKVDTRAAGGYVVAAGSVVKGRAYAVERDAPPAPLPAWLTYLLTPRPAPASRRVNALRQQIKVPDAYASAALRGELEKVQSARQGGRNRALYNAAYALARLITVGTLPEGEVTSALTAAGLSVGLDTRECATAIRSGITRGGTRRQGSAA